jgi:CheY-like chemotaxis protein
MSQPHDPKGGRVLVVDDDASVADVLTDALEDAGYNVVVAETGRDGLALAPTADIMLLDLGLPDMDGVTVCRALRTVPDLARLPVMMLTARGEPPDRVRGIQSGADDYLAKPFDVMEVLARVEALLRSRQIERELRERNRQLDALRQLMAVLVDAGAVEQRAQRIVDAVPRACGSDAGVLGGVISRVDLTAKTIRAHAMTDVPAARQALALMKRPLAEHGSSIDPPMNLQHDVAVTGEPRSAAHLADFVSPTLSRSLALAIERTIGMRGGIAFPSRARGQVVGVFLFVLTKPVEQVSPTERSLMAELADTAGVALDDARLQATGTPSPSGRGLG